MQGQFQIIVYYTRKTDFAQANICGTRVLSALKVRDFFVDCGYGFLKSTVVLYVTRKGKQIMRSITPDLDDRYLKAVSTVEKNEVRLSYLLSGEEKRLFLELMEAQRVINEFTATKNRISGLQEGMQMNF